MNDSILHQKNKIEILGKVFQQFRDVIEYVRQDVLNVIRFGVPIGYKVHRSSVLGLYNILDSKVQ